jgi:endonuclease/exonuclease/phosphatase family metal-dependent hydrolase
MPGFPARRESRHFLWVELQKEEIIRVAETHLNSRRKKQFAQSSVSSLDEGDWRDDRIVYYRMVCMVFRMELARTRSSEI